MELNGELAPPDLAGLTPSNDNTGISQLYPILPQQYFPVTTSVMDYALEAQPQLPALRGVILIHPSRPEQPPGGRGPVCDGQPTSKTGLNRVRHHRGGLHGDCDT